MMSLVSAIAPGAPRLAFGQAPRRVVMVLGAPEGSPHYRAWVAAFTQTLARLGWTVPGNLALTVRSAAGAAPHVLNPSSVPYTRGHAAVTVRCDAEHACDGTATLRSAKGVVLGTVEYYLAPGQPAQLMIPARRPGQALLQWRSRNGVESQTDITVINT